MIESQQRATFTEQLQQRRRGRGRPRSSALKVRITVDVPDDAFAALCRLARLERKSLHALVRETLTVRAR